MEIYNENMERIENPDLSLGYLRNSTRTEHHEAVEGVRERWHYETIKEYEPSGTFDEVLFEQIIEKIVVDDSSKITFHLIGGLTLTEEIKEKGRCKTA